MKKKKLRCPRSVVGETKSTASRLGLPKCGMESPESKKLHEIEMLMSMYPKEFHMDDLCPFLDLKEFVENENSESAPFGRRLRYSIKLDSLKKGAADLTFDLPSKYPEELPDILIRGDFTNKTVAALTSSAKCFVKENIPVGEPSVLAIIQWMNDNIDSYVHQLSASPKGNEVKKEDKYFRYWIYSHHIYNKVKRRAIIDSAKKLNLTGFSCPGKPGIICIEGLEKDVDAFWQEIRSLSWKKIMLKHHECLSLDPKQERKFTKFEEKGFQSPGCHETHLDAGALLKFLQENNLQHIFHIYFGVSGSLTSDDLK